MQFYFKLKRRRHGALSTTTQWLYQYPGCVRVLNDEYTANDTACCKDRQIFVTGIHEGSGSRSHLPVWPYSSMMGECCIRYSSAFRSTGRLLAIGAEVWTAGDAPEANTVFQSWTLRGRLAWSLPIRLCGECAHDPGRTGSDRCEKWQRGRDLLSFLCSTRGIVIVVSQTILSSALTKAARVRSTTSSACSAMVERSLQEQARPGRLTTLLPGVLVTVTLGLLRPRGGTIRYPAQNPGSLQNPRISLLGDAHRGPIICKLASANWRPHSRHTT